MAALDDELANRMIVALREVDRRERAGAEDTARLRARVEALIEVLIASEVLGPGHRKHIERSAMNPPAEKPRVRLSQVRDKYQMVHGEPVDCAARMHLCKARCCSYTVLLSSQDLDEGKLVWDHQEPYHLRKGPDGRCHYQERGTGHCTAYDHRPGICREYSCKDDARIWLDFDNMIPAPVVPLEPDPDL